MSVDKDTVKRVAKLARISVTDREAEGLQDELNAILGFVDVNRTLFQFPSCVRRLPGRLAFRIGSGPGGGGLSFSFP